MAKGLKLVSLPTMLLAAGVALNCHAHCSKLVGSASEQAKPFVWLNADKTELIGPIPELAALVANDIGMPMSFKYVGPWRRAQNDLRMGNIDLLWGAFRTKEREEYAHFVPTPLTRSRSIVLSRIEDEWQFSSFSDLEGRAGVLLLGDSFGEAFDKYASERLSIKRVTNVASAIKMLEVKRADYLVLDEEIARATLASLGTQKIRISDTEVAGEDLFLLISNKSDCNTPELRDHLNSALLKANKNKTLLNLLVKYRGQ